MIHWNYVLSEIFRRWRRTSVSISLIAFSIGVLIIVNAVGDSFQQAFRAPLEDMGATLTVQRSGDIPEKMEGPVLPCSVAPIDEKEALHMGQLPGVRSISRALLLWDFDVKGFKIIVGIQPDDVSGPALLRKALLSGRFLDNRDEKTAVVDLSFARDNSLEPGKTLHIQGDEFKIVGIADSSRISQLAFAHVYVPLQEAQRLALNSPSVKAVHKFGENDTNLLFVQADRDKSEQIANTIKEIMGKKTTVSTPTSFKEMLGGVFALTDRFSITVSMLALLVALALVARTTAANARERKAEIGTMKAVGWTRKDIMGQLGTETLIIIALGVIGGVLLGFAVSKALSLVTISIPIPWEMSPKPHFMPGGGDQITRDVRLNVSVSFQLMAYALVASILIGIGSAWAMARSITKLNPSEVLRYE